MSIFVKQCLLILLNIAKNTPQHVRVVPCVWGGRAACIGRCGAVRAGRCARDAAGGWAGTAAAAQRRTVLFAVALELGLLQVGVCLNLVDDRLWIGRSKVRGQGQLVQSAARSANTQLHQGGSKPAA